MIWYRPLFGAHPPNRTGRAFDALDAGLDQHVLPANGVTGHDAERLGPIGAQVAHVAVQEIFGKEVLKLGALLRRGAVPKLVPDAEGDLKDPGALLRARRLAPQPCIRSGRLRPGP